MSKLERFNTTVGDLETELGKLQETTSAYRKLKKLVDDYAVISQEWEANNKIITSFIQQQKTIAQETEQHFADNQNTVEKQHEALMRQNKTAYVDLENTLRIRLEDSKSEIKRMIENERAQVQQIVDKAVNEQTVVLAQKQKTLMTVLLVFAGLSLVALLLIVVKLYLKF